jgi:hypothetical protein
MSRREYFVYDGATCIGHFVVDEETGNAKAFDAAGRSLGTFAGYAAARLVVSNSYDGAKARAAASGKDIVEFASGLPHVQSGG